MQNARKKKKQKKGISLMLIHSILSIFSLALVVSMIVTTNLTERGYEKINVLTDSYVRCTNDVFAMDETSDFLTSRAREYVAEGIQTSCEAYVTEYSTSKTREKALENVEKYFADTSVAYHLNQALASSNLLADREFYAMRLASVFYGENKVPVLVQQTALKEEDKALSPEQAKEKAVDLVFGSDYLALKGKIDDSVQTCLSHVISVSEARKQEVNDSLKLILTFHEIAGVALLLIVIGSALTTLFFVLLPLKHVKVSVEEQREIEPKGSREIRFATNAYNAVFKENERQKSILQYEVSHDTLTGIPNRHDYIANCNMFANANLRFVIADVDHFKGINDTYGHDIGDMVLSEVARRLSEAFLHHDRVFRIGGDEFVVLVFDASSKRLAQVKDTLNNLNAALQSLHKKKNFPEVSLSFGISHKKSSTTFEEAYRNADRALYTAKKGGGNACMTFEELKTD